MGLFLQKIYQIVKDYKNNIIHQDLIEKFAELDKQNILYASKTHLIPEYKKICINVIHIYINKKAP